LCVSTVPDNLRHAAALGRPLERFFNGAVITAEARTALLWATYADELDAAAWLLDHGADADLRHDFGGAQHGKGAVAMHLAAQFSCLKVLRLLLERGARADIEDAAFHATPRGWAQYENSAASLALLDEFALSAGR
jgi:ankyrin repeat protein